MNNRQSFPATNQPPPQLNLQQAINTFQNHCSSFLQNLSHQFPPFNPNNFHNQTKQAINTLFSGFSPNSKFNPGSGLKNPLWARVSQTQLENASQSRVSMSTEAIEERLAGVPVYALSNANEEFVLVSGRSTEKSLGLFCFKKEDAEALLDQMKNMDPAMRKGGSKVVPVALNKVFQLKVNGVAFRLIPEPSQVKNALMERERAGLSDDGFSGVPIFQSRSLVLKSQNKSYRPVFFRKEDLEKSLSRASREQQKLNPALRLGDIQVAVFEEVIKNMKEGSSATWDDVVFIPPGFDVSTTPPKQ